MNLLMLIWIIPLQFDVFIPTESTGKVKVLVGHVHQKKSVLYDNYIGQMVERFKTVTSWKSVVVMNSNHAHNK